MEVKAGDWVEVRSPLEIIETLDEDGTLRGLPFMPEMLEHCGKRFRVLRRAEKTCVELPGSYYAIREFLDNDVVLLDGLRCPGSSHDGCQRMCLLFWKTAWLKPVQETQSPSAVRPEELNALRSKLRTKVSADQYFCQSSQLSVATNSRQLSRAEILVKSCRDVLSGAVGAAEMFRLILVPLYRKVRDALFGRPRLLGNLTKTPVGNLNLQPGELVEIRDMEEMRQTLDTRGRNRGMVCDIELKKFCGKRYRVLARLDRMISEPTGEMRNVQGTVLLDGNTCMCARVVGGCPRFEFCYWREAWLKRVGPPQQAERVADEQLSCRA
jgi:hypothetical protein